MATFDQIAENVNILLSTNEISTSQSTVFFVLSSLSTGWIPRLIYM